MTEYSHNPKCHKTFSIDLNKNKSKGKINAKKRSCSVECKSRAMNFLNYVEKTKKNQGKIRGGLRKTSQANRNTGMKSIKNPVRGVKKKSISESFCSDLSSSDIDNCREDVKRNVSFICEDLYENISEKNNEEIQSTKEVISKYTQEIKNTKEVIKKENNLIDIYEDRIKKHIEKENIIKGFQGMAKIKDFGCLNIFPQENIECIAYKNPKKPLSDEHFKGLSIRATIKKGKSQICPNQPILTIQGKRKPFLNIQNLPYISIKQKRNNKYKKTLDITGITSFTIRPIKSIKDKNAKNHFEEQLSWNLALKFLIEQLQIYETTNIPEFSSDKQNSFINKIQKKYTNILNHLAEIFETKSKEFFENASIEEHSNFIQKTHKKKVELHKILIESTKNDIQNFHIKIQNEESSDEDIDDVVAKLGISRSHSLIKLHDEMSSKSKTVSEGNSGENKAFPLSFGFEDDLFSENQCFSLKPNHSSSPPILPQIKPQTLKPHLSEYMDYSQIQNLIISVFSKINTDEFLKNLQNPLIKPPLNELTKIQEHEIGMLTDIQIFDFPELFNLNDFITENLSSNQKTNYQNIYNKMILQTLNIILQEFRPFGKKGLPMPWVHNGDYYKKPVYLSQVIKKVLEDFRVLNNMKIGVYADFGKVGNGNDKMVEMRIKEDNVINAIFYEAYCEEDKWIDYEFEETQVKFDLADMILQDLAEEIIYIN
ncbi:hypothetical protein SteCoe_18246 [Stentor coeruleus]|uniref:DUF4378 domain-containing protein n=1 Tax=Stentor coeruleus TaxID=5963 RepID=A0A1R2BWZ4_9CILI|nr:hypothetical protein SteCoe_18246 [Stentor coeruleus]